jgi:hypothetical protein
MSLLKRVSYHIKKPSAPIIFLLNGMEVGEVGLQKPHSLKKCFKTQP